MRIDNDFLTLIKHVIVLDRLEDLFGDHPSGDEAITVVQQAVDALVAKINAAHDAATKAIYYLAKDAADTAITIKMIDEDDQS
ncbi:hypothetical protein SAMN05518849_11664 [Sphingobium sp. AP50]|uniref:hypothetical protein n=1 Tax=Sphingobium sp. AP50 TaxID=1884369 RepID=UPI0008D2FB7E|nr:hypothetical protein [Sphingobium sp. AP50]SEJ87230.1 hypothetical protein SAMN05518849_11664 [Sphingobium sp. AP50]